MGARCILLGDLAELGTRNVHHDTHSWAKSVATGLGVPCRLVVPNPQRAGSDYFRIGDYTGVDGFEATPFVTRQENTSLSPS